MVLFACCGKNPCRNEPQDEIGSRCELWRTDAEVASDGIEFLTPWAVAA